MACVTRLGMCVCGVTAHSSLSLNQGVVRDKMFLCVGIENLDAIQAGKQSIIASKGKCYPIAHVKVKATHLVIDVDTRN